MLTTFTRKSLLTTALALGTGTACVIARPVSIDGWT